MASCGGDPKSTATLATGATSTTEAPTTTAPTTTAAPTSGTSATTRLTTTTARPATNTATCPLAAMGGGATDVTTKPGDFDGNGVADTLRAYRLATDWHLRVELAGGGSGYDLVVPGIDAVSGLKAVGGFNLGGGPADEAFAVVAGGASMTFVGIFVFTNCQLIRATELGNVTSYGIGASAQQRSGLRCVAGTALQVLAAQPAPNTGAPLTAVRTNFDLVGSSFVQAGAPTQETLGLNDPLLAAFSKFDCGSLSLN